MNQFNPTADGLLAKFDNMKLKPKLLSGFSVVLGRKLIKS
jgi:hypothetical protein